VALLFFDECIPSRVTFAMRALYIGSTDVRRVGLRGASDEDLASECKKRGAIFVTYDFDFTSTPLFAAMAKEGICVVLIRRPKGADLAITAEIVVRNFRRWPDLCGHEPTIISCSVRGCRARQLRDLPYNVRPPLPPIDEQLHIEFPESS
jgi:predicted nuclease of predicted toxin-antitoxin system